MCIAQLLNNIVPAVVGVLQTLFAAFVLWYIRKQTNLTREIQLSNKLT